MNKLKEYYTPELVLVVLQEEIVRTSGVPGEGEGELPVQPFLS